MNTDFSITMETCPYSNDGDRITLSATSEAFTWAGELPWEYLNPLKRLGFLPIDVSGPLPASTRLSRIMPSDTMDEAEDFIISALDLLEPDLGRPKYFGHQVSNDYEARLALWENNPNWSLAIGIIRPCPRYPEPTVILQINPRYN